MECVQREAHTGHLLEVVRKIEGFITCSPLESRVSSHHQKTTAIRHDVHGLLTRLEELHVHWSAYQGQLDQLHEWCSQATETLSSIELINLDRPALREKFNQIWVSISDFLLLFEI